MCKGAQHKVYSTMYNILGRVTIIRDTRTGLRFSEHLCATRGYRDQDRYRAHHSGSAATATAYVRAHLVTHVRMKPRNVLNHGGGGENGPLDDGRIMRCEHGWPTQTRSHAAPPHTAAAAAVAVQMCKQHAMSSSATRRTCEELERHARIMRGG